ncbi:7361_t:CDS:2 [Rhizophagus irregularis]|nr:7361_t:CDS:2 [Rhizophagus irregularis]
MGSVRSADEVCKTLGISAADTSPGALEKMQNNFKLIGEEIIRDENRDKELKSGSDKRLQNSPKNKGCWQDNPDDRPDMRKVLSELMLVNINEKLVKTWENTTASDNYSSNDYTSIKSLLHNSLSCLLQLGNEGITTKTTDVQSRSSKNELLRSFLKDHKESLKL